MKFPAWMKYMLNYVTPFTEAGEKRETSQALGETIANRVFVYDATDGLRTWWLRGRLTMPFAPTKKSSVPSSFRGRRWRVVSWPIYFFDEQGRESHLVYFLEVPDCLPPSSPCDKLQYEPRVASFKKVQRTHVGSILLKLQWICSSFSNYLALLPTYVIKQVNKSTINAHLPFLTSHENDWVFNFWKQFCAVHLLCIFFFCVCGISLHFLLIEELNVS